MKWVTVSGGFDPLHKGHLNLFCEARKLGTHLAVIVNDDRWVAKKHKVLMPQGDRAEIIKHIAGVDSVLLDSHESGDVSETLRILRPAIHAVGPDHSNLQELQECETCKELGIKLVSLNRLVKDQTTSSSGIIKQYSPELEWHNPPVVVNTIIRNSVGAVLLCVRGHEDGLGMLELPGGFLEDGETLEEGARREVREELRMALDHVAYLNSYCGVYSDGRKIVSVVFLGISHTAPKHTPEVLNFHWVSGLPPKSEVFGDCDWPALSDYFVMAEKMKGGC